MKIGLLGPSYPFKGGIAHYTTLLYRHLKTRHEVKFYSFKRQYPEWLYPGKGDKDASASALREAGAEQILDSMNPATWMQAWRGLQPFQPDLVILPWWVYFWTPHFLYLSKRIKQHLNSKLLFICHNVVAHESSRLAQLCTALVLKRGDLFLVHSQEDEGNLKRILPHARITRAFHPSYDVFQQDGISKAAARQKLGLRGNTILFFGFVRPYKGLRYALEALPAILQKVQTHLLVVGEFWEGKEEYLGLIKQLGIESHVTVLDRYVANEEIPFYFAAADLLVMPYTSATGSGLVQLAFGLNMPVIVSNVGALPEVVRDGETGFVVPARDANAVAEKVVQYYHENLETRFRENVKKDLPRFSWEGLIDKIETLYRTAS